MMHFEHPLLVYVYITINTFVVVQYKESGGRSSLFLTCYGGETV